MVLITQSYNALKPSKLSQAWKKKVVHNIHFFNYIIKLQAVLDCSSHLECTEGTTVFDHISEEVKGSTALHGYQTGSWQDEWSQWCISVCRTWFCLSCKFTCFLSAQQSWWRMLLEILLLFFSRGLPCFPLDCQVGLLVRLRILIIMWL